MYELERHTLFYTDEGARELYKQHVQKIMQRKNTITGVAYKDDPIILGWALLNELRCESWKVRLLVHIMSSRAACHLSAIKSIACDQIALKLHIVGHAEQCIGATRRGG